MAHKKCTSYRDSLIADHLQITRKVARKIARRSQHLLPTEDIEGAALLGLIQAADRYDSTRCEPFLGFAIKRVRGAIKDELRRVDELSRRSRKRARTVARVSAELEQRLGRPANDNEVASEADLTVAELAEVRSCEHASTTFSYDDERAAGDRTGSPDIVEEIDRRRHIESMRAAMTELSDRDRQVVELYYFGSLSLREIGERLGVSESRVCQLRGRAERTLRAAILARTAAPANDARAAA